MFGDNDDWDQLLSRFSSTPHRALQLCWSPPPTPKASSAPQTPRVVRQISISEPQGLLFGQEPSSDADVAPSTPPGVSSGAKEGEGVDPDGQDLGLVQPKEESGAGPEAHFLWDLPRAPSGEPGSLVAAALKALIPLEDAHPLQVASPPSEATAGTSKQSRASHPDAKDSWTGPIPAKPPRQREALHQDSPATGPEPGLMSPEAGALTAGLAEPSRGLERVAQAPTEGSEQGGLGTDVQEGHPGALREAHGQVRPDGLPALPQQSLEEEPRAEERKQVGPGGQGLSSEQPAKAQGLGTGHSEQPPQDSLPTPLPRGTLQAEAEAPAPGTPSPPRGSPTRGAQPGVEAEPQPPMKTLPSVATPESQPGPPPTTAQAEGGQDPLQSGGPRAEDRPEHLGTDPGEAGLNPTPGGPTDIEPPADPDHIFHVIVLGDSNVGKTSFLHLLHQNTFATGLTATVGKGPSGGRREPGPANEPGQAPSVPSLGKLQALSWPRARQ